MDRWLGWPDIVKDVVWCVAVLFGLFASLIAVADEGFHSPGFKVSASIALITIAAALILSIN